MKFHASMVREKNSPTDGDDVGILSELFAIDVKAVPLPDAVELSVD